MWIALALGSAFLTAVLGTVTKVGLEKVNPTVALAVTTTLAGVLAWVAVASSGKFGELGKIEGKSWAVLGVAGVLTLAGTLVYYKALGSGPSSGAQPVDRLSLVFAVVMAGLFLKEKISPMMMVGTALMAGGAILIAMGAPKE